MGGEWYNMESAKPSLRMNFIMLPILTQSTNPHFILQLEQCNTENIRINIFTNNIEALLWR